MTTFLFLEFDVIGHSILRKFKGSHFKTKWRVLFVQILPYIMGDTSLACEVPKVHINLSLFVLYIQKTKLGIDDRTSNNFNSPSSWIRLRATIKVYARLFSSYFYQLFLPFQIIGHLTFLILSLTTHLIHIFIQNITSFVVVCFINTSSSRMT